MTDFVRKSRLVKPHHASLFLIFLVLTDDDKSSWVGFSLTMPYTQGALCLSAEAELNKSNQHDMGAAEDACTFL